MAVQTDHSTSATDTDVERPGQWLIEQLRAEQRRADDRRLAELLAVHALPRPRAGS